MLLHTTHRTTLAPSPGAFLPATAFLLQMPAISAFVPVPSGLPEL